MDNKVALTAYYCAGVRMLDAEGPEPLLHDELAGAFMEDEGKRVFEGFRHLAVPNGTNQVRCFLIDERVRARLADDPDLHVVLVGAGFDSRAFRMSGGHWLEIDEAPIMARKEAVAPAITAPNPLRRVTIDFSRETLADKLAPFRIVVPTLVIVEGVLMYLPIQQRDVLIQALAEAFPRHTLLADMMRKPFSDTYGTATRDALAKVGASFREMEDEPVARFLRQGYRLSEKVSIIEEAVRMKRVPLPQAVLDAMIADPARREGYELFVLDRG